MKNLKKKDTNEFIYKTEIDSQTQKTNYGFPESGSSPVSQLFTSGGQKY